MVCSASRWRGLYPIQITTRWPLTMTLRCWSSASRWSSPTPSNPSAYHLPPTSSLQAWPAGSQAGVPNEKEVFYIWFPAVTDHVCILFFFFFSIGFFFFFTLNSSQNENIPHSFHLCSSSISLVSSPSVFILFFIFCSLSLQSWHTALVSFRFNLLFPH